MYVVCIMLCVRSFVNLCCLHKVTALHLLFSRVLLLTVVLNSFMIFMVVTLSSTTLILTLLFVVLRSLEVWILISQPKVYCMGTSANLYAYVGVLSMMIFLFSFLLPHFYSALLLLLFLPPPPLPPSSSSSSLLLLPPLPPSSSL